MTPRHATSVTRPAAGRPPAPDPSRLAGLLATVWLEVQRGRRPFQQLRPLLAPALQRRLGAQVRRRTPSAPAAEARVRRVIATSPSDGTCEAVVLVDHGQRTTAIAIRMERHRGAWRVVELTAPEDGLAPLRTSSAGDHGPIRDAFDEAEDEEISAFRRRDSV